MDPEIGLKDLKSKVDNRSISERQFREFCLNLQAFFIKHSHEMFWNNFSGTSKDLLVDLIVRTCECGFLPDYNGSDELVYEFYSSFSKSNWGASSLSAVSQAVSWLLQENVGGDIKLLEKLIIPIFILCYTHSVEEEWIGPNTKGKACGLIKLFGELFFKQSDIRLEDIVNEKFSYPYSQGIFKSILLFLQTKFGSRNWRNNGCYKKILYYTLSHASPHMVSVNINALIPPSLILVDDYNTKNQILAIRCLHKIIHDVSGAELRLHGKADVIYNTLYKLSYSKEPELVEVVHPCILSILSVIENPYKNDDSNIWTKYDSLFNKMLIDMEMEQRLVLRRAYSQHLLMYIDQMGVHSVKHMKRFMGVLSKYLEVYEGYEEPTRKNMLKALQMFISNSSSQHFIFNHIEELLKSLLKLMYDIDENNLSDRVREELIQLLSSCLKGLQNIDHDKFDTICSCINFETTPSTFKSRWKICMDQH